MTGLQRDLQDFYQAHGFGDVVGKRPPRTVLVYTGCLLVPMPNLETRRKYLLAHDLHHLMTGYSVGRIGEGRVSAWELGTGTMYQHPVLGVMNLIALSTGLVLDRRSMWAAFQRGCSSANLYKGVDREAVRAGQWETVQDLQDEFLHRHPRGFPEWVRKVEFFCYASVALLIHAAVAIPAVIIRFCSDLTGSDGWVKAFQPQRRSDLF